MNMKIYILLGPPGAGKGTVAKYLVKSLKASYIATGDLFREAVANKTLLGKKVKEYMDKGVLVPDSLVNALVDEKIYELKLKNAPFLILDGFPRNIEQAITLEEILAKLDLAIEKVIYFDIPSKKIIERLSNRRVCKKCGAIFNLVSMKPKIDGVCDNCGGELFQRDDDKEEVIMKRLKVYEAQTKELVELYKSKGILYTIDASKKVSAVNSQVKKLILKNKNH